MKQKLKQHKGITLIALIITIIVLLILAAVAIAAIKGDGIISHAKNAKLQYSGAQKNEQSILQGYIDQLDESQLVSKKVKDNLNKVLSTSGNITLEDDFENKIKVPAGFKILVDNTTGYTADTIDVTKGIVVEDEEGNQFVWIPVGVIKNASVTSTITLGRYSEFSKTKGYKFTQEPGLLFATSGTPYYEENEHATNNDNQVLAKDIKAFVNKTNASGGYYIGRYEARTGTERKAKTDTLTLLTSKADDYVYNWVTQPQASERCQSMYTNKPYESDLVNSYAWDTTIIFLQEFGDNANYYTKKSVNSSLANTGTSGTSYTGTKDIICNVYDMASNCWEWTTERYGNGIGITFRGGNFSSTTGPYTSMRIDNPSNDAEVCYSFRPVLYM